MALATDKGVLSWKMDVNKEGHRIYNLVQLVEVDGTGYGPATILASGTIPTIGTPWLVGDDFDLWALCLPTRKITVHQEKKGDLNVWWEVESTFSTAPGDRCQDTQIEDPLLEPQRISGSFTKVTKEAFVDKDNNPILSSSFEKIPIEVEHSRPTVRIGQNVADLGLDVFGPMINKLNDAELWGVPARGVKLSSVAWSRKVLGSCDYYYTRAFDFDVDLGDLGFDIRIADEGFKKLKDGGDKTNPDHFEHIKDKNDENISKPMPLDNNGNVAPNEAGIGKIDVEFYQEANFLALGIPTVL